ncbi:MAG: aspartate/glutamate racemase family protein [Rhodospirillales bacterium]|nr:aspartate/glutamate racemase family protein [Rhodospirillales bacterium]
MPSQTRIGMITPSLNTVLEPVTYALLADLPDVTAHFSRVRVTQISLGEDSAAQFADEPMLAAARMLADARVHAICWNGTAGSWLGPDFDRRLCQSIARETGIPATSATLALAELFRSRGVKRFALVTPFEDVLQEAIIDTYRREGFDCVAERHLDSADTFGYASIPPATTEGMIRSVTGAEPEAIAAVCTNLMGAPHAQALEAEAGRPVYDSVAAALWGTLALAGADPSRIAGWGEIFSVAPASLERLGARP